MRFALPVLAGVAVLIGVLLWHRRFRPGNAVVPLPEGDAGLDEAGALALVTGVCQGDGKFRVAWEGAVRETADHMTARIAGARMAGRTGIVRGECRLPVFLGLDPDLTRAAFALAVREEVTRRVEAMPLPGGFG
jgi:hypothetical protein